MLHLRHNLVRTAMPLAMLFAGVLPLRAAEHVVLRNGFELDCTARETVGGRVRLYTGAGTEDYLEVAPDAIMRTEALPAGVAAAQGSDPLPAAAGLPGAAAPTSSGTSVTELRAIADRAGRSHNIDADLLSSIIRTESGGNARAISPKGARGLMQLMPATATAMGVTDSFVPEQNVAGGAAYLDRLLAMYHDDIVLAVAAYNAGPAAVARWHGVPPYRETREYVARVVREFNRRKLAAR